MRFLVNIGIETIKIFHTIFEIQNLIPTRLIEFIKSPFVVVVLLFSLSFFFLVSTGKFLPFSSGLNLLYINCFRLTNMTLI